MAKNLPQIVVHPKPNLDNIILEDHPKKHGCEVDCHETKHACWSCLENKIHVWIANVNWNLSSNNLGDWPTAEVHWWAAPTLRDTATHNSGIKLNFGSCLSIYSPNKLFAGLCRSVVWNATVWFRLKSNSRAGCGHIWDLQHDMKHSLAPNKQTKQETCHNSKLPKNPTACKHGVLNQVKTLFSTGPILFYLALDKSCRKANNKTAVVQWYTAFFGFVAVMKWKLVQMSENKVPAHETMILVTGTNYNGFDSVMVCWCLRVCAHGGNPVIGAKPGKCINCIQQWYCKDDWPCWRLAMLVMIAWDNQQFLSLYQMFDPHIAACENWLCSTKEAWIPATIPILGATNRLNVEYGIPRQPSPRHDITVPQFKNEKRQQ